jgi:hypothetical protein
MNLVRMKIRRGYVKSLFYGQLLFRRSPFYKAKVVF